LEVTRLTGGTLGHAAKPRAGCGVAGARYSTLAWRADFNAPVPHKRLPDIAGYVARDGNLLPRERCGRVRMSDEHAERSRAELLAEWRAAERAKTAAESAVRATSQAMQAATTAGDAAAASEEAAQAALESADRARAAATKAKRAAALATEAARDASVTAEGDAARATQVADQAHVAERKAKDDYQNVGQAHAEDVPPEETRR